jgi:hypothetical protein
VRFRLHILKAKNNKGDFTYAPKASSNVQDAVLKVISKDCALQCEWTALEDNGFELHAFLPKPTANGPKIANHGAFISIDARPVSNSRGTTKQVVAAFTERLRKSNSSLANVKHPFLCMNIICPPDSYDSNVEPAKDDVMFDDSKFVLNVVDKLLGSYYAEAVVDVGLKPPTSAQQHVEPAIEEASSDARNANITHEEAPADFNEGPARILGRSEPRWRSSMYGIDEDDLEHLQEDQPLVYEEEQGLRAADVSNPWTIACMNTTIKPKASTTNGQLLSPAKSHGEVSAQPSSPAPFRTPLRQSPAAPLTPQTLSRADRLASTLNSEYGSTAQIPPQDDLDTERQSASLNLRSSPLHDRLPFGWPPSGLVSRDQTPVPVQIGPSQDRRHPVHVAPATRQRKRKQTAHDADSYADGIEGPADTWFGQPMRGTQPFRPRHRQKLRQDQDPPLFPTSTLSFPRRSILTAAEGGGGSRLYSENNTDIRDFFGQSDRGRNNELPSASSFTPINGPASMQTNSQGSSRRGNARERRASQLMSSRATSFEVMSRPRLNKDVARMPFHDDHGLQPPNTSNQFVIHEDDPMPPQRTRPYSADSERPLISPIRSNGRPANSSRDMAAYFKAYQDHENVSLNPSSSAIRRQGPRIAPPHELENKTCPQRRRTTDGAQRSRSSKLPLERVPQGCHIQNVVMNMRLSIASIIQSSCKLDMTRNSLEYNYVVEDAFDTFAEPVSERKIMEWVMKLDAMLHEQFEQLPDADVRSMLHEAVQRGLDARKDEPSRTLDIPRPSPQAVMVENSPKEVTKIPLEGHAELQVSSSKTEDAGHQESRPVSLKAEDTSDFDLSQFAEFDMRTVDENVTTASLVKQTVEKTKEEYGEDIEDDMLLDL